MPSIPARIVTKLSHQHSRKPQSGRMYPTIFWEPHAHNASEMLNEMSDPDELSLSRILQAAKKNTRQRTPRCPEAEKDIIRRSPRLRRRTRRKRTKRKIHLRITTRVAKRIATNIVDCSIQGSRRPHRFATLYLSSSFRVLKQKLKHSSHSSSANPH